MVDSQLHNVLSSRRSNSALMVDRQSQNDNDVYKCNFPKDGLDHSTTAVKDGDSHSTAMRNLATILSSVPRRFVQGHSVYASKWVRDEAGPTFVYTNCLLLQQRAFRCGLNVLSWLLSALGISKPLDQFNFDSSDHLVPLLR